MNKQWRNALIVFVAILLIGGIGVYKYRNVCIIKAVEYGLSGEMDPTKDMHLSDYKNVEEYAKACQEVEANYEKLMFEVIAKNFWSTPEHVKQMYIDYIENQ